MDLAGHIVRARRARRARPGNEPGEFISATNGITALLGYRLESYELQGACSAKSYVATLKERRSELSKEKLLKTWKRTLRDLGDGKDFFQKALLRSSERHPETGLKTYYLKNRDDLDWDAVERELDLPPDLRWRADEGASSANWLLYADKVRGTERL